MIDKPAIIVDFDDPEAVVWHSCGWGQDKPLLLLAKNCIKEADTLTEVVQNLSDAGFRVIITTVASGSC